MSEPKVYEVGTRGKFVALFARPDVVITEHWKLTPEGSSIPDRRLKIVARQLLLEDGSIVQLKAD